MTDYSAGNARVSKPVRVVPLADTQRLPTISPFSHIRTHELQYPCRRNGFGPARAAPRIHCELNSRQRQENFGHTKFLKLSHDRIVRRMHVPQAASNVPCGWASGARRVEFRRKREDRAVSRTVSSSRSVSLPRRTETSSAYSSTRNVPGMSILRSLRTVSAGANATTAIPAARTAASCGKRIVRITPMSG